MGNTTAHNSTEQGPRKRRLKRFGTVLLIVLAVVAGLLGYAEYRCEVIRAAPVVTHAGVPPDYIRFEAVLRPLCALDWLAVRKDLNGSPRWLVEHCLPREIGILLKSGPVPEPLILTLYANPQRMTPLFVFLLNRARVLPDAACLAWDAMGFHAPRAGLAAAHAIVQFDQGAFADYRVIDAPPRHESAGQDLLEIMLDNRDGQALAALMALHAAMAAEPPFYTPRELAQNLECVVAIHAGANLVDDALAGRCRFICLPDAAETAVADLAYLIEVVRDEGARVLRDTWGVGLFVDIRREGTDIVCDFRMDGMMQLLDRLNEGK